MPFLRNFRVYALLATNGRTRGHRAHTSDASVGTKRHKGTFGTTEERATNSLDGVSTVILPAIQNLDKEKGTKEGECRSSAYLSKVNGI